MDKENLCPPLCNRRSNITPEKNRLGKFEDVYSPNHLNKTPNARYGKFNHGECPISKYPLSPHYPANKCRTDKLIRTKPLIFDTVEECSFEGNQSFPGINRRRVSGMMELESKPKNLDTVRVDGPNGLRFNSSLASVFTPSEVSCSSNQADRYPQGINPNKAVFTIEPKTSKILIVNSKACSLLNYTSANLCGMKFSDLIKNNKNKQLKFHERDDGDVGTDEGTIVLLSGKVVELTSNSGGTVIVSLWIRKLEHDGPCLVVAEPVNAKQVVFTVDNETGTITSCDNEEAVVIFQTDSLDRIIGQPVTTFVPCIVLPQNDKSKIPKQIAKQKATGRTLDGATLPLSLWVRRQNSIDDSKQLEITIRVTLNVSGLLVVDENGIVTACNHHFSMLIFGKKHSEVIGHPIEKIIPNFCRPSDAVQMPEKKIRKIVYSNYDDEELSDGSETEQDSCGLYNGIGVGDRSPRAGTAVAVDTHTPTPTQDMISSFSTRGENDTSVLPDITSGMSGISIDEDVFNKSLSKSRSENILRSDKSVTPKLEDRNSMRSDSLYKTVDSQESHTTPKEARLSLDCAKYRNSLKSYQAVQVTDRSSLSLDICDSNETSADFLTPINEMPAACCETDDSTKLNGTECAIDSFSVDEIVESSPRRLVEEWSACTRGVTSTPARRQAAVSYRGRLKHRDGVELNVAYTVSSVLLSSGRRVACVWVAPDTHAQAVPSSVDTTADNSLQANKSIGSRPHSMSMVSQCGEEQISGEYHKHYVTLKQIGKGAYGCVKMAYRRSDKLLVVAKFILKDKVCSQFWVDAPEKNGKKIPLEVSLLLTIKHPNIVNVLEVLENDKYFQMIMEKHGSGMDLFEFIERFPTLDEPLTSYIFRQIGQAVEYLHSLSILHRDIKDENVIIDNKFQVKLIDFGSATFRSPDTLFSTFYGTTEYCSPEVLAGNKYAGPELEMWSMGITLYVLTFFVNPFSDIEDTIHGELVMHEPVSSSLQELLAWMLNKDPLQRCTIPQLMAHPWITQTVAIQNYTFSDVVQCSRSEANPEAYYTGAITPRSVSPNSAAEQGVKGQNQSQKQEDRNQSKDELKRSSYAQYALSADAQSENYSLRSSADILDISSKPVSEGCTDVSSDATGHAACDIDPDIDQYDDSWDEQDSFS